MNACSVRNLLTEKILDATNGAIYMPEIVIDEYSLETANRVGDTAIYEPLAPSVDTQNCRSVGSRSIGLDELRVAASP